VISFPFICVIFKLVSPVERIKRCYQDMKLTENVQFGERLAGRIQQNGGRKEILAKVGVCIDEMKKLFALEFC